MANIQRMTKEQLIEHAKSDEDVDLVLDPDSSREDMIDRIYAKTNAKRLAEQDVANDPETSDERRAQSDRVIAKMEQMMDLMLLERGMKPVGDVPSGFVNPDKLQDYPKVAVLIHSSEAPGGDRPITLGFNGKQWSVPRDKSVVLPEPVFETLKNARGTQFEQKGIDPKSGNIIWAERHVNRFGYTAEKVVA